MQITSNQKKDCYVGWVPCLTGQLVFGLVECGLKDNNYRTIEIHHICQGMSGNPVEHVLLHSTVNWKDFGDQDLKGLWSVVLLSERSLENRIHEGTVYLMLLGDEELNGVLDVAHDINHKLKCGKEVDAKNFSGLQEKINKLCLHKPHFYKVGFNLEEDGVVWLSPFNQGYSTDSCQIIARQAYYYIKYAWHRHQHHDSRAETLTTTHAVPSDGNNKEIAKKLIEDLKRNLVIFKRGIDSSSHRQVLKAKGILSYAKALVEIMKSRDFICDKFYEKELNHLNYFEESLGVISDGIEKDISMHNQAVNDARALILFVFAVITPALVINRNHITEIYKSNPIPSYIKWVGDFFSTGTAFSFLICTVTLFFIVYISLQTRFGNFLILMGWIKRAVARIVNDNREKDLFSNATVLSGSIISIGILIIMFSLHGVFLEVSH
jgi:hypothetical protein